MQLIFTKSGGSNPARYDRLDIVTETGPRPPIDCPKQRIIPHDMVHFAVEAEVAARGFLGLAAAGNSGLTAGNHDAEARSIERLVETFQGEGWSGAPVADAEFLGLYAVTCDARGDTPLAVDAAMLAAIRARIAALTGEWAAVPVGGRLVLTLRAG